MYVTKQEFASISSSVTSFVEYMNEDHKLTTWGMDALIHATTALALHSKESLAWFEEVGKKITHHLGINQENWDLSVNLCKLLDGRFRGSQATKVIEELSYSTGISKEKLAEDIKHYGEIVQSLEYEE